MVVSSITWAFADIPLKGCWRLSEQCFGNDSSVFSTLQSPSAGAGGEEGRWLFLTQSRKSPVLGAPGGVWLQLGQHLRARVCGKRAPTGSCCCCPRHRGEGGREGGGHSAGTELAAYCKGESQMLGRFKWDFRKKLF